MNELEGYLTNHCGEELTASMVYHIHELVKTMLENARDEGRDEQSTGNYLLHGGRREDPGEWQHY
ncbi:hypothetical protein LCGC14_0264470 [marine sediment metagenome]|uniref:Uncharacterized protein n=1 Tax=marine sediment metagenome TaxID=412755 RepID=A0A0F9U0Y6_9ZZZZ